MRIPVSLLLCITAACFSALHDTASASGVCSVSGAGHYYTFDGTKFNYQGMCQLNFSSDCKGANATSIKLNFEYRYLDPFVSFVSYITVTFGTVVTIIGHYPSSTDPVSVRVQGTKAVLPVISLDYSIMEVNETCDIAILLDVPAYNFQIRYNEWGVILIVDDSYKSKMCGICGNFNDYSADDLIDGTFDANIYSPNSGRAWGDHFANQSCLTPMPTPDDVPNCTYNSFSCSTVCNYLVDSTVTGIFRSAVAAMGGTLAQYYQQDCRMDACVTNGQSYRKSVRQFVNYARFKYPSCAGCQTTIGGFPLDYTRFWCRDDGCDCNLYSVHCHLQVGLPFCGYWCDCIGLSGGYGTLYQCWDGAIDNRCYLLTDSMADTCNATSGIEGHSIFPFLPPY